MSPLRHPQGLSNEYVKDYPCPPFLQSATLNILQVTNVDRGVLDIIVIRLEKWNVAHMCETTWQENPLCQWCPLFFISPFNIAQCPPSCQCGQRGSYMIMTYYVNVDLWDMKGEGPSKLSAVARRRKDGAEFPREGWTRSSQNEGRVAPWNSSPLRSLSKVLTEFQYHQTYSLLGLAVIFSLL